MPTPQRIRTSRSPARGRAPAGPLERTVRNLAIGCCLLFGGVILAPLLNSVAETPAAAAVGKAANNLISPPAPVDQHFSGCDAARAAGREDIPLGDPSYRDWMDGDGDGLACEPWRGR